MHLSLVLVAGGRGNLMGVEEERRQWGQSVLEVRWSLDNRLTRVRSVQTPEYRSVSGTRVTIGAKDTRRLREEKKKARCL